MDLNSLIRPRPALDLLWVNVLLDPMIPLFCWRFRLVVESTFPHLATFVKSKKKKIIEELENISWSLYGSGRTEEPVRMLETSSEEWEVVRKLPASFLYILAGVNFWINSGSKNRGFDRIPRNFIFLVVGSIPRHKLFLFFFDLVKNFMTDVGRKSIMCCVSPVFFAICTCCLFFLVPSLSEEQKQAMWSAPPLTTWCDNLNEEQQLPSEVRGRRRRETTAQLANPHVKIRGKQKPEIFELKTWLPVTRQQVMWNRSGHLVGGTSEKV